MAANSKPFELCIPSNLRMLPLVRTFIEEVCREAGCDARMAYAVVVATDEAVNNIIRHAHRALPEATIQIRCFLHPDGIEVRLFDEGEPFDLVAVPHLDPSELRLGGRGVFLMRTLMDELSCQPLGEHGNMLRMVKRYSAAAIRRGA